MNISQVFIRVTVNEVVLPPSSLLDNWNDSRDIRFKFLSYTFYLPSQF